MEHATDAVMLTQQDVPYVNELDKTRMFALYNDILSFLDVKRHPNAMVRSPASLVTALAFCYQIWRVFRPEVFQMVTGMN